jgi:hypothetical protein
VRVAPHADEKGLSCAFRDLDAILRAHGLDGHVEPEVLAELFSCDMFGYSGIHYLRRTAANQALGRPTGDDCEIPGSCAAGPE